jgi:hypothetical protein
MEFFLVFIVMILGGIVQGMCGFGAGLVAMSILSFFLDYKIALPVMFITSTVISSQLLIKTHEHINWKAFLMPVIFSVLGRIFSMLAVTNLDSTVLKLILGVIIIATAIYQLLYSNKIKIKANHKNGAIAGGLSGIMGGLASTGGPPLVVYYMNCELKKEEYLSTLQLTFLVGSLFSIGITAASGGYSGGVLYYAIPAAAGIITGAMIGRNIFNKISNEQLKKIINMVLIALGVSLLIKTLITLIA